MMSSKSSCLVRNALHLCFLYNLVENACDRETIDISASPSIEMIDLTTPSTIDLCTPEDKIEEDMTDLSLLHVSSK